MRPVNGSTTSPSRKRTGRSASKRRFWPPPGAAFLLHGRKPVTSWTRRVTYSRQTIPDHECLIDRAAQNGPPFAQKRAQWRRRAACRGMAARCLLRAGFATRFRQTARSVPSTAAESFQHGAFRAIKCEKGTEKVHVWYIYARKLAVLRGFYEHRKPGVSDKTRSLRSCEALLQHTRDRLQTPGSSPACPMPLVVQCRRDSPQRSAVVA